jgi:hypothetical protein
MANILLVEPDYRSKFPPLGLLRISSYHKDRGDSITFVRGLNPALKALSWHKIYISSLFTFELPRTIQTIKFYRPAVDRDEDIIVGGIAATLNPAYIRQNVPCRIIEGSLTSPRMLDGERVAIGKLTPDYSLIEGPKWQYQPRDTYFCRATVGCIRRCDFCAVPSLEPKFAFVESLAAQIKKVICDHGEKQHLVLLDNNILASPEFSKIIKDIKGAGFASGAKRNGRERTVDFNQGIDARLITESVAKHLRSIALSPVRLAFDFAGMKRAYEQAIRILADQGVIEFTNYVMFNFQDDPKDFYERLRFNADLSASLDIRITGFPMKYSPTTEVNRRYIAPKWQWRHLRGIQCILLATHGLVSPNLVFFQAAFGVDYEQFMETICMPDRYIIFRNKYENGAVSDWRRLYRRLQPSNREEFLDLLSLINRSRQKLQLIASQRRFRALLEHYYPEGKPTPCE